MTRKSTNLIVTNERGGKTTLHRETFLLRFFTSAATNHLYTVAQSHFSSRTNCSRWADRAERRV